MKLDGAPRSREGLSLKKFAHFYDVLKGGARGADAYLDQFTDFDVEVLRYITGKQIAHLLVDIDACIAPAYGPLKVENILHCDALQAQGVDIGIYSNCKTMDRLKPLEERNIPFYEGVHPKPAEEGFLDACAQMEFDPKKTWMVGENPNTDGGAIGVLEGMAFVAPIPEDPHFLSLKKKLIVPFQNLFRGMSIVATTHQNDRLLFSADLEIARKNWKKG
jgi:predicted HAD superfamily phosphohydrolase YqeG